MCPEVAKPLPDATRSGRVDILGVKVSATNMNRALAELTEIIESDRRGNYVCVSDVNALMNASTDPELTQVFNNSALTVPDGMPLVWSGRRAGASWMNRVSGPDLMPALLELSVSKGWGSYFLGGSPEVIEVLVDTMQDRYPGLAVSGQMSPPFRELSDAEWLEIIAEINASGANIVWLCLGAPKQERWMGKFAKHLDANLVLGVGAAFDMHAGKVKRAPLWMQRSGLEWSYRLMQEPRRLYKRYLVNIPRFMIRILRRPPSMDAA